MLANLTPFAVDTLLVERLRILGKASDKLSSVAGALLSRFGRFVLVAESRGRFGEAYVHPDCYLAPGAGSYTRPLPSLDGVRLLTVADVVEAVSAGHQKARGLERLVVDLGAAEEAEAEARLAVEECNAEYDRRPWPRYWLVTTSDGHIHASTHCCTCHKGKSRTGFALVPYLSGKTAEHAVADLDPALCSVCFPAAPVESREQARISSKLALCLAEEGCEAFQKARREAAAKVAARCPGSGQKGLPRPSGRLVECPCCGDVSKPLSNGNVRPHKPARYTVENADRKAWNGTGWGPGTRATVYATKGEAEAVAAAVGGKVRRK